MCRERFGGLVNVSLIEIHTDGLCGPASLGGTATFAYLIRKSGKLVEKESGVVGKGEGMTNNVAEYAALVHALERIRELALTDEEIIVNSDSRLVVEQMSGNWKVKSKSIKPLFRKARELVEGMRITFRWVPREQNTDADRLCRAAYNRDLSK
jgi:ribonuclease HI